MELSIVILDPTVLVHAVVSAVVAGAVILGAVWGLLALGEAR